MNRRGFLAALAGLMVADPERLLWVPGKKLISIPKPLLPGVLIHISSAGWPGANHSRITEILKKVDQMRGNREIMEAGWGQQIFAVRGRTGALTSELQVFIAPEGAPRSSHYRLDSSKFQQVTLNA
jgi:hypothetical protein